MENFLIPLINRRSDKILLHVGTNDLRSGTPKEVAHRISNLTGVITSRNVKCAVSSIIRRGDYLATKGEEVNRLLGNILPEHVKLISNSNINENHPNRSQLHLNRSGTGAFAHNIIQFIKHSDLGKKNLFDVSLTEPDDFKSKINDASVSSLHSIVGSQKLTLNSDKGLKVVFLNIDSLYKHLDELNLFSDEHSSHVICLNETKLNQDICDELLQIDGFQKVIRRDRSRHGGGVAIFVKDGITCQKRDDFNSDIEFLSVELDIKYVKPIIVTTIYRPPESKVEWFKQAEGLISRVDIEGKESIFAGDMNCDLLKPRDNDTKHIKRIYSIYQFKQMINEATRITSDSKPLIDHVSTNKPDRVSSSGIIPRGISDHDAVYLVRCMRMPKMRREPKTVTVRKCRRSDLDAFKSDLQGVHFDEIKSLSSDPNEMWLIWKTLSSDVLNKHAPITNIKIKGNNLPYITPEVRQLARQRDYLRKKANKTGSKYL